MPEPSICSTPEPQMPTQHDSLPRLEVVGAQVQSTVSHLRNWLMSLVKPRNKPKLLHCPQLEHAAVQSTSVFCVKDELTRAMRQSSTELLSRLAIVVAAWPREFWDVSM